MESAKKSYLKVKELMVEERRKRKGIEKEMEDLKGGGTSAASPSQGDELRREMELRLSEMEG